MAFSIVGPGVRDEVKLDNLFREKVIEKVDGSVPVRHIDKNLVISEQQQYGRERIRQAYDEGGSSKPYKELVAEQLMSSPVMSLALQTPVLRAWEFFRQHRFRHVPVIDADGKLQGIISDRDLLSVLESYLPGSQEKRVDTIDGIMQAPVLTATTDTVISQIAAVFFRQRIGAMPILKDDKLAGIITRSDILGAVVYSSQYETWV